MKITRELHLFVEWEPGNTEGGFCSSWYYRGASDYIFRSISVDQF